MKKKYHLFKLSALVLFISFFAYCCSVPETKTHSARVEALPLYSTDVNEGEYRLAANNYEYLVRVAGMKNKGANLILLHGFPESSIMWEALVKKAAKEGYRVLAYDQRGYSPGARPKEVKEYHINKLSADVLAIAEKAGFDKFHLVGHDWGAAVGWKTVMDTPERILSWTALSIPHLGVFLNGVVNEPEQKKRSSYFKFFQSPQKPEEAFLANKQAGLKKLLAKLPKNQVDEYLAIFAEPGAFTAALNWYRALEVKSLVAGKELVKPVNVPILFIWGSQDPTVSPSLIPKQKDFIKGQYQELRLESGHALIQHQEKAVIKAILTHLKNSQRIQK